MTFKTLAFTYVLGGLTFLPLLVIAILVPAWLLLPKHVASKASGDDGEESGVEAEKVLGELQERKLSGQITDESAASGTFAVLRRHDFKAAIAALNAKNSANGNAGSGSGSLDGAVAGEDGTNSGSQSVYQTMYRSVFDRNKNVSTTSTLLENGDDPENAASRSGKRRPAPPNVLYIVLRHGHLMLYDSPAQVQVKLVIRLAHHSISLQAGSGDFEEDLEPNMLEADLFVKRTAIVLTPVELPDGTLQTSSRQTRSRPFYLFCATNIEKEDFYHALLATRTRPPTPQFLSQESLIKLQSTLHSQTLTPETRAINALLGRVFLSLQHTDYLSRFILSKIEKKLSRIQKPSFIPSLTIKSLELGDAAPAFSNPRLKDLNISGDLTLSADLRYTGGLSLTLLAVAKLDLGPRFKPRTVDLMLKTSLQRIHGTMLLRVKPPPSNRIWFTFESTPEMEVRVEPVVSERKITYGFILRAIEERIKSAIGEGLVKPNWDDVPMPLTDTRGHLRGGLWSDEGDTDEILRRSSAPAEIPTEQNQKTMSTSTLVGLDTDSRASTTGVSSSSEVDLAKLRHSATMPIAVERHLKRRSVVSPHELDSTSNAAADKEQRNSSLPPKPLRSSSFGSRETTPPIVAIDNAERVRDGDLNLKSATAQGRRSWLLRNNGASPSAPRDALNELRNVRDRAENGPAKSTALPADEADGRDDDEENKEDLDDHSLGDNPVDDNSSGHSREIMDASTVASASSPISTNRTDSDLSTASSVRNQQSLQQRKATMFAATAAATSAARNWGWNAIQRNKANFPRTPTQQAQDVNQPMGRGQPLPPPGMPLPGPQKPLWPSVGGSLKRKPVPPLPLRRPQRGVTEGTGREDNDVEQSERSTQEAEDEFGPWRENSGPSTEELVDTPGDHPDSDTTRSENDGALHQRTKASRHKEVDEQAGDTNDPAISHSGDLLPSQQDHVAQRRQGKKPPPPPLPARRRRSPQPIVEDDNASLDSAQNDDSDTTSQALRVPDSAADAVAAENATSELEHGAADDQEHIDEVAGVEAEVGPHNERHAEAELQPRRQDDYIEEDPRMVDRFVHGQDVGEEDFESEGVRDESQDGVPSPSPAAHGRA